MIAADGLNSQLRQRLSDDEPISSAYVAYRGALPMSDLPDLSDLALDDVVVYVGPGCHLVQYPCVKARCSIRSRSSPKALAGEDDWGTPDELDAAFAGTCNPVRAALPHLWRDGCWRMYDREPIVGRIALTGDATHPMLQYLAQGACQALEDAAQMAESVAQQTGDQATDWERALSSYAKVRTTRTARVQRTARQWGDLRHCEGLFRATRNALPTERDPHDYRYTDWLYGA